MRSLGARVGAKEPVGTQKTNRNPAESKEELKMASVQLSVLGREARESRFWNKATETMPRTKLNAGFVEVEPIAGFTHFKLGA
ncbi:MAG: hypothetical protein A3G20_07945 [Acidobacteria bacterium RIFCSPLOWO2_12_FULL_59_11]|nr:MAG: hypothetical protein A3G20_07945 [Acidobacteria bacterium RIFCSPLOWO2_12_FULL_59_11]